MLFVCMKGGDSHVAKFCVKIIFVIVIFWLRFSVSDYINFAKTALSCCNFPLEVKTIMGVCPQEGSKTMNNLKSTTKYSYYQTGFSVRNIRSIFNSLSEDSYFTVKLYQDMPEDGEPLFEASGNKEMAADYLRMRFKSLDARWIFRNMDMQCNSGFGNSVTLILYNKNS